MKINLPKAIAAIAVALLATFPVQAGEGWSENFKESVAKAKAEKKLVLLEFTGSDWCPPCKKQAAEVFATDEFKDYAKKNLVLVELDFPRGKEQSDALKAHHKELKEKFAIRGFPTVIMLDGDEKELARWVGYGTGGGPAKMIANIEKLQK